MHRLRDALVSRSAWLVVAVVVVVLAHVLGSPRNVGPDEASHQVASAALVRGDRSGIPVPGSSTVEDFLLPGMVGVPKPTCFAFQPDVSVVCSQVILTTDTHQVGTSSQHYPPFAMFLPGLASFVPWAEGYAYLARLLSAIIPVALVAAALVRVRRRRSSLTTVALLAGATPIAWFTWGVLNPSAAAIAGATALWAALATVDDDRRLPWLAVLGWAAIITARRDGPYWVTVVVLLAAILLRTPPSRWWALASMGQRVTIGLAWLAAIVSVRTDTANSFPLVMAATPLALVVLPPVAARLRRLSTAVVAAVVLIVAGLGAVVLYALSPKSVGGGYLVRLVEATGEHLYQLVGRLGTLDASAPLTSVLLWWATVGGLAALALLFAPHHFRTGLLLLGTVIVSAWLLEIGSGNRSATYWQGRYSLPATIALPFVLALATEDRLDSVRRGAQRGVAAAVAVVAWWVWNATFFAAQRRWAVGAGGSWFPWNWSTWDSPLPPVLVLFVHALASAALLLIVLTPPRRPAEVAA
ncbi:MAG: hypothetical protein ACOYMR_01375 [Ilumatobacteraceae bacterium]